MYLRVFDHLINIAIVIINVINASYNDAIPLKFNILRNIYHKMIDIEDRMHNR